MTTKNHSTDVTEEMTLDEALEKIRSELKLDENQQFLQQGVVYQRVLQFRPQHSRSNVVVSIAVDHTPKSKYNGQALRELRAKNGVGNRPTKAAE